MSYTHFIEGTQVYPSGDWEIKQESPTGCLFKRRVFSGKLTFGNILHNGSNDYDFIMSYTDCQRLDYEIKCNGVTYWEGYLNHTIGYETDEDNCLITTEPLLSDEYDCFVIYGDVEYKFSDLSGLEDHEVYIIDKSGSVPYDIEGIPEMWKLEYFINHIINDSDAINADSVCGFTGDIVSSFFWNDNYPDGSANVNNYITGANYWDDIFVAKNTAVRIALGGSGTTTDPLYTFNEVMGWLRDMFNVYWYLDYNGDFRLEHLHFFEHDFTDRDNTLLPDDFDLTAIRNKVTNKVLSDGKNKWKYQSDMPSEETLELQESDSEDFIGLPITYDEDCTFNYPKKRSNTFSAGRAFTDIPRLADDPDAFTSQGFTLVAAKYENLDQVTDLLTGWPTDSGYDTFIAPGDNITFAINTAGAAYGRSNSIGSYTNGDTVIVQIKGYTNNGGENPSIRLVDVGGNTKSFIMNINADNTYLLPVSGCPAATTLYVQVANTAACDWSFTDAIVVLGEDEWVVQWQTGEITAVNQNNGHLSVANLMEYYWQHGRVLISGNMNGAAVIFDSVRPNRLQTKISIPKCCDTLHWNTYIKTDLGDGYPYSIVEKKDTYEVELLYP